VEGYNTAQLDWGASGAKTATVSFYVKCSVTGNIPFVIVNSNDTRVYAANCTVSSANTWEYKTITIDGDISGTWLKTNGIGLKFQWYMALGSNFQGTLDQWGTDYGASGQINVCNTNGATFQVTGVQLEVGEQATPFEHRSYGDELARCQRYYFKFLEGGTKEIGVGWYYTATHLSFMFRYPTTMRATPTATDTTGTNYYIVYRNGGSDTFNSVSFENGSTEQFSAYNNTEISGTAGQAGIVRSNNASAKIEFDAEL